MTTADQLNRARLAIANLRDALRAARQRAAALEAELRIHQRADADLAKLSTYNVIREAAHHALDAMEMREWVRVDREIDGALAKYRASLD